MLHLPDPMSDHITPSRFEYDIRRIMQNELKEEFGYKSKDEINGEIEQYNTTRQANDAVS